MPLGSDTSTVTFLGARPVFSSLRFFWGQARFDYELLPRFATRLLAIDSDVAEQWGRTSAQVNAKGFVLPVIDGLIAATALVHGLTVVTRNVSDIQISGVSVFNPWESCQ